MNIIARPFGALLMLLYHLVGNYGIAILLFTVVVKLVLLPFQMKSKRSMMRMSRFTPRMKELEKKYAGNQQKYQAELAKLYREEKVNPMSGCIWTLIPFPILIALYGAIRRPLTTMMGVPNALLSEGGAILNKLNELGFESVGRSAYEQIHQSQFITEHFSSFAGLSDKLVNLDYNFLGVNLGDVPSFRLWEVDWSNRAVWLPALLLFLVPIFSAAASVLTTLVSQKTNPQQQIDGNAANTMKGMFFIMPVMSLWIGYSMPAALGVYWVANSLLGALQELVLNKHYTKILDKEDAERRQRQAAKEAELESKREKTEKLRAEGKTTKNANTSKKRIQAQEKAKEEARIAALEREEKAKRRARLGVETAKPGDSQVGTRQFARGRAYVADRYPDVPEEETAQDTETAEEK